MDRCLRNDVGSLVLDRSTHAGSGGHSRIWSSFSASSLRRMIIDSMRCGGGGSGRRRSEVAAKHLAPLPAKPLAKSESGSEKTSEKLMDLLNLSSSSESEDCFAGGGDEEAEVRRKVEKFEELSMVVRLLQRAGVQERENGAKMARKLAKEDGDARSTLAMLGAIPPLVGIVDDAEIRDDFRVEALYALLNLGIGNDLNKAAIVQAGALHKMLKMIESSNGSPDSTVSEAIVANFLALSALDSNKTIIGLSGAIPFLVNILKDLDKKCCSQAMQDSLRALYNLSILPSNIPLILETELVRFLLNSLGDMEVSERTLSILNNIVAIPEGRKALASIPDVFPTLIDVLSWMDSPGCQEKASYILMVMAHKAYNDRRTMVEAGIVSALLELTLIGSTLAQKRASRILECLRVGKGKRLPEGGNSTGAVSAPQYGGPSSSSYAFNKGLKDGFESEEMMSEEKKAVKQLVQQSLQNNMRKIVRRANLPQDIAPSEHFKSLTSSSTSKSLPF
ncbi:hypothetical protein V2J09_003421 [Rumex salicifolius]